MPIKIYKMDLSPPARAVMMIADILKLNYETQEVNLVAGEHLKPEYLEKNPMHSVPLLEDGDFLLADSHAIITYLVSKYGAERRAELYPSDFNLRATIDQRLFFNASVLFPARMAIVKSILKQNASGPSSAQIADVNNAYSVLDEYLRRSKFVACDFLTVADVSCVATISSMAFMVPIDAKYEKLNAWWNTLKEEEWYKRANIPGLRQLESIWKAAIEKSNGASSK